jgi:type I restriction enzyme S subunit
LAELVIETKDGDWGKDSPAEGFTSYRVIRGTDFPSARVGNVSSVPLRYISERTAYRRTLKADDILIETAGGSRDRPTGRTLLVTSQLLELLGKPATCASFARFLRIDKSKADPRFIFWYLQYLHQVGEMWEHQVQHTGVARFQYTRFATTHQIAFPSMSQQGAIADILGTLDAKITVNDRIATTALKLAGASYREIIDNTTAMTTLGDVIELKYGKALPKTARIEGTVPVYGSGGLSGSHNEALVEGPGIIVGRKGTVGTVYWCDTEFFPIDTTFFVIPKSPNLPIEFAFFLLGSLGLEGMNSDSAVPGLNRNNALSLQVRMPNDTQLSHFRHQAQPLFQLRLAVQSESKILASLRDTLLPKLMSGEIRVRDAEKAVEDAA